MNTQREPKFYSELKQLNNDLIKYLQLNQETSPYFNFTATLNDYIRQIDDLIKKYPPTDSSTTTNLFTSTSSPSTLDKSAGVPAGLNTSTPFQFGSSSIFSPPSAPTFSFAAAVAPRKEETVQNEDPDDKEDKDALPPVPVIDKYEEQGAKYSVKCKIYDKSSKTSSGDISTILLGIGNCYIKSLEANKLQVIVRQDPDLRRVLLNQTITEKIPIKLLPKAVQIALPVQGETKVYILKVKDERDADALYQHLKL